MRLRFTLLQLLLLLRNHPSLFLPQTLLVDLLHALHDRVQSWARSRQPISVMSGAYPLVLPGDIWIR